jgi:hypothetical protein
MAAAGALADPPATFRAQMDLRRDVELFWSFPAGIQGKIVALQQERSFFDQDLRPHWEKQLEAWLEISLLEGTMTTSDVATARRLARPWSELQG